MSEHLLEHGTRATPQSEPMRPDQVENSAGGYVWAIDDLDRLRRFLILGSEGGSYYASERALTFENVQVVRELVRTRGVEVVEQVVAISESGRAPQNEAALYALAVAISLGDRETKLAAGLALPRVARTGTHLFHFVAYAKTMRGFGPILVKAIAGWYDQAPAALSLQVVKYRQRDGWSHRDLLRLSHPRGTDEQAAIYDWVAHREQRDTPYSFEMVGGRAGLIDGFERAQRAETPQRTAELVREYGLPREALNPDHLTDPDVWRAMLERGMPLTAMVRNLANMTRIGVLDGEWQEYVTRTLSNTAAIRKARVHPLTLLVALRTYASGHGFRGGNVWRPIPSVIDALDAAFYLAFENVESTGKSHLLALDVSGSMSQDQVAGSPLTPREASVAMALVTLHAEQNVEVVGFSDRLRALSLSRRQRLDDAVRSVSGLPFERTDCALPMLDAIQRGTRPEAFVILTDSETWFGDVHPKQALDMYREKSGVNARVAVVGMVSNGFSIADPADAGMLDVVGMDTATPALIADFAAGRI